MISLNNRCMHCGGSIHTGMCPSIQAIVYHANGAVEYVFHKQTYGTTPIVLISTTVYYPESTMGVRPVLSNEKYYEEA